MKNLTCTVLIVFIGMMFSYGQCDSVDVIQEPGFEINAKPPFYNSNEGAWLTNDGHIMDQENPYEGNFSFCFANGSVSQEFDLLPNKDYLLSFWVRVPANKSMIGGVYKSLSNGNTDRIASKSWTETNGWEQVFMPFSIESEYLNLILDFAGTNACLDSFELCMVDSYINSNIIRVPQDYDAIQDAVDAANDNEIVLIAPGTYTVTETIIVDKPIKITSEYLNSGNESDVDATVITGPSNLDPLVLFTETATGAECTGLTFKGAHKQVTLECEFMKVTYCKFFDNGSDALNIEGAGGYFAYNYFENNGDEAIDADNSLDWIAEYNTIINPGDDGFEIRLHNNDGSLRSHIIRYNYISGADEDGIQLIDYDGDSGRKFKIHNNVIRNSAMVGLGTTRSGNTVEDFEGSYMEEEVLVYNNVFDNNNYGITGANNMAVLNNIIVNNETVGLKKLDNNSYADYNCLFNNGTDFDNATADPNNIFVNPLLKTDYTLEPTSLCIDAGVSFSSKNGLITAVYIANISGNSIDIGAKEFTGIEEVANTAPTVSLGKNEILLSPNNNLLLPSEVSDDGLPQNGSLTTLWTLESGPEGENVIFDDNTSAETNVTFSNQGVYELKLMANDGEETSSDIITVFFVDDYSDTAVELNESTYIEAEDYRYLVGSAELFDFTGASEGEIVTAPLGAGTYAYSEYRLVTFSEGSYYVWVNASGLDEGSNGLNVSFNGLENEFSLETTVTNSFGDESWVMVAFENIPEGVYPLRISATEEGVGWDRIFVTTDANEIPFETKPSDLKVYPVPNQGEFIIALKSTELTKLNVFNIQGQLVYNTEVINTLFASIDVGVVGKGVYVLSIENEEEIITKKIIIN
ncbi:T9SS type A sorting domain-containing protein [Maribacter sp. ACAM166]|uniref:T9SS type A sorting domain-containing protein n=1 Tax=Maribacter sp. ACAM166 TaxID=2508996 RepID=UPI0010FE24CF|nr:right-handed parallel beta-helix repeat-containing protein [Maribacter sp. ACAM166]TLP80752.1 T9SS type A sorting domain-containing protein [Maribacter sp. ACAM166]